MNNIQILKRIFGSYIKTIGIMKFISIVLFGFFVSTVIVLEPLIFTEIIKKIENFYTTGVFNVNDFITYVIIWGGFILFSIGLQYMYRYFFVSKSVLNNHRDISVENSEKIVSMTYRNYLTVKTGSIYKIFDRGVESQELFLFFCMLDLLKALVGTGIIIAVMFYINLKMSLVTLAMFPLLLLFGFIFYKKLFPLQQKLNNKWDEIYGDIGNIMSNFFLVKSMGLEKSFKKSLRHDISDSTIKQLHIDKGWSISDIYIGAFVMLSRILVIGFGVYYLMNGEISFATLFLFFSYIGWIYFPMGMLLNRLRSVQAQLSAVGKFYETMDSLEQEKPENKASKLKNIEGNIDFNKIIFGYSEKKMILKNISFSVKAGEKVALVGTTGAGKSTIVNLLLRLWDVEHGNIKIDDKNINKISKKSLREHIGVVSQDNSLFNMSIKENLLYANPKADKQELEEALQKAQAEFVFDLEEGVDTLIGERGLKLSGGEKQRISIARLFLKNPKILILDEATSALDNKTEKAIQKALDKLMLGRTSIIIAHRLTTIMDVDTIHVLEKGEIVESGSYKKLIKQNGTFAELASGNHLMIN
ncbi:MAG: ABC transporter ATP-binding protein [Candidatus Gracilibacteria bacterium]|nr:ABC transporter ATP-binding protein [Candidatus Gracilibacteria bacterium]